MSAVTGSVLKFGYHKTQQAMLQRVKEIQHQVDLYEQLMRDEPEFRYHYELERDNLLHEAAQLTGQIKALGHSQPKVA